MTWADRFPEKKREMFMQILILWAPQESRVEDRVQAINVLVIMFTVLLLPRGTLPFRHLLRMSKLDARFQASCRLLSYGHCWNRQR